jgi:hypothetical protein
MTLGWRDEPPDGCRLERIAALFRSALAWRTLIGSDPFVCCASRVIVILHFLVFFSCSFFYSFAPVLTTVSLLLSCASVCAAACPALFSVSP